MTPDFLALGAIWYIVFLFSTTCHEGAHSLAAHLGGDSTAFQSGQVSLNPLPHIRREPVGMVIVPILSYIFGYWMMGWASAPYDPHWQQRYPRRAAWMALAGPAANFTLAILSGIAIRAGMAFGIFQPPESVDFTHITAAAVPGIAGFAATVLSVLFILNVVLGTFNLLPVPPLDGNTAITLLMSESAGRRFLDWTHNMGLGVAGLLLAWFLYGRIFGFIFQTSLSLLYPGSRWG
jgi:Zn-dependent protease